MIRIIHADVIDGLKQIPDQTMQCVVTSPPYWGLRDYGVDGQIGLEKTPEEYVAKMVDVFREVRRVLRDDGTVWLNLGDCYATSPAGNKVWKQGAIFDGRDMSGHHTSGILDRSPRPGDGGNYRENKPNVNYDVKQKDLIGMPWRVAFALQADGWYLRSDIIWSKPNPMPESVTDRPTKSHEYIFLLTKKARYYYDADAVREKYLQSSIDRPKYEYNKNGINPSAAVTKNPAVKGQGIIECNPAGRNRRTVWEIATQPFPMAHFATFPEALVEPCIKAGTSEGGCCSVCGAPWVRVVEKEYPEIRITKTNGPIGDHGFLGNQRRDDPVKIQTSGWQPTCSCNADTVPCVVLDPFGGSGTVGKVARDLNRKAILIELNAEYIKIAKERLRLNEQLGAFA